MKRIGKIVSTAAIAFLICIAGVLPVQVNAVEEIEGFCYNNGVYYKLISNSTSFTQCNCFTKKQDNIFVEVGQYVSIPIHLLEFSSDYQVSLEDKERKSDSIRCQCADKHMVSYASSNPEVCTVSQDGIVTALEEGEAEITVISGDYYAVTTLKINVIKPQRVLTTEYQTLTNLFNMIYQKYGQSGSVNDKNYKVAWNEIMRVDKQWKSYSSGVEKTYGQDAETKERYYANSDITAQYRSETKEWHEVTDCTLKQIAKYEYQSPHSQLTGWGDSFCDKLLVHSDSWKLEEAVKNLSLYVETINPYNKDNNNAFQIRSAKLEKNGNQLVIRLKKPITEKQILGSYMSYRDTNMEPLIWSAMLHNGFTKMSIPCVATIRQESSKFTYKVELYEGNYKKGVDKIVLKRKNRNLNKANMFAGTYQVKLNPIIQYWSPDKLSYDFPMDVSATIKEE